MRFEIAAMVGGKNLISVGHVTRARVDLAPDWPRPLRNDAYRLVIEGDPRLEVEAEFTAASGDHLAGGFGMTAMRAINAIPHVVTAERRRVVRVRSPGHHREGQVPVMRLEGKVAIVVGAA